MKKVFSIIGMLILISFVMTFAVNSSLSKNYEKTHGESADLAVNEFLMGKKVHVDYVIDGDTFCTTIDGKEEKVRLIGIDTPESVASEEYLEKTGKSSTEEGAEASEFTKSLIEGQDVVLAYDVEKYDQYGRVLAYVYLQDGKMLQDILLKEGYANLFTSPPNVRHADRFTNIVNKREGHEN